MKFLFVSIFVLIAGLTTAQDLSVQTRINSLYDEAMEFRKTDPEKARLTVRTALTLSAINGHFRHGQLAYILGDFFLDASAFDSAYFYYGQAIDFLEEKDPTLGRSFFGKSYVEFFKGQYEKSLASVIQAEKIAQANRCGQYFLSGTALGLKNIFAYLVVWIREHFLKTQQH